MNAVVEDIITEDPLKALREVFTYGIENGKSEDEIKMAMIKEGATFKNVTRTFNQFSIDAGLVMKKEEKEHIVNEACVGLDITSEEIYNEVIDSLIDQLTGVEENGVARLVRAWAKKNEVEVFKKGKGAGGTRQSGFRFKFYQALIANPHMSKENAEELIKSEGSGNDVRHMTQYQGIREMVNSIASS